MTSSAVVLDGKAIAAKHLGRLSQELAELRLSKGALTLCTIQVGTAHDTHLYAKSIENLLKKLGMGYEGLNFSEDIREEDLRKEVLRVGRNSKITGLMLFAPLPKHILLENILSAMDILKDAEGRRMPSTSKARVMPPTALAAITLFDETGCDATGKEALVIGRSDVVGKPAAWLMLEKNATVTMAHSRTADLKAHVERADIIIVSVGKAAYIKGDWIKPGAIVIDVGENVVNGKLVGDVEFEKAKDKASYISPVPGGVGPVTNVMLVQNLISLYKLQNIRHGNP